MDALSNAILMAEEVTKRQLERAEEIVAQYCDDDSTPERVFAIAQLLAINMAMMKK